MRRITVGTDAMQVTWGAILIAVILGLPAAAPAESSVDLNESAQAATTREGHTTMQKATFAAGCFWGVEAAFRQVKGVTSTTVGYTGGTFKNPTYEDVCQHKTGHAESVEVEYDPGQVSYDELLEVFWKIHNPTTKNRQGPDVGSQYRSVIFYHTPAQQASAEASKARQERSKRYKAPIVTEIATAPTFYRAEEYHQQYAEKHGGAQCPLPSK